MISVIALSTQTKKCKKVTTIPIFCSLVETDLSKALDINTTKNNENKKSTSPIGYASLVYAMKYNLNTSKLLQLCFLFQIEV